MLETVSPRSAVWECGGGKGTKKEEGKHNGKRCGHNEAQQQKFDKNFKKILMTHQSNNVHFHHRARLVISNHDE